MTPRESATIPAMARGHTAVDGLRLLRQRWPVLVVAAVLGTAAAIAYYSLTDRWYRSEIMIVPKESGMGGLGTVGAMLGDLPFDVGGAGAGGNSNAERIAAILKSRSTTDAVIQKFDLLERYNLDKIEKARKKVWALCATKVEKKPNLVVLTCEDTEPEVARDMAEYFGQVGDEGFRRIASSSASEERKFLEKRVTEAHADLNKASMALRVFQEKNKIIDLPEQSKAVVSAMAELEGDVISKRVQLSYLSGFASRDESSASQLGRQIQILRKEIRNLEQNRSPALEVAGAAGAAGDKAGADEPDMFPRAMQVPELRYQLEGLFREQKIRETVFFLLTERYESLKIDEARDLSTFVVFDHAALPTHRIRPRMRVVPIGMMGGLLFGIMIITVPAWMRDLRRRAAVERAS